MEQRENRSEADTAPWKEAKATTSHTRILARIALIAALSFTLSLFSFPAIPGGGSVSLMMVPLYLLAFIDGPSAAIAAGVLTGAVKLILNAHRYGFVQMLLDYPIAFGVVGFAGLSSMMVPAILITCLMRFLIHGVSGWLYFNVSFYTALQINALHMIPETCVTILVLLLLKKKNVFAQLQKIIGSRVEEQKNLTVRKKD